MVTLFFPYTLTLAAPLLATQIEGDAGSAATARFIPGSMIRGAVAARINPEEPGFRDLIISGKVCFLNCYPQSSAGHRSIPVPASWRSAKYSSSKHYYDLSGYASEREWPNEELEKVPAEFVTLDQPDLRWVRVATTFKMHHQRDRKLGHATQRTGLFSYEAIDAGQKFGGCVVIKGADQQEVNSLFNQVDGLMQNALLLGRSRRAEYGGLASVSWIKREGQERELASYSSYLNNDIKPGERFRVLLTSDYIGKSHTGLINPNALINELVDLLGPDSVETVGQFLSSRRIGGFNRKWQLPLPQVLALAAGSIVVMKAKKRIPLSKLNALESEPLGERVAEGYGRISFLAAANPMPLITEDSQPTRVSVIDGIETPPLVIQQAERRLLYQALTNEAYRVARNIKVCEPPSRSLIGRFRAVLRMPHEKAFKQIRAWLKNDDKDPDALRRQARDQLKRCQVKWPDHPRRSMYDWLQDFVGDATLVHLAQDLRVEFISMKCMLTNKHSAEESAKQLLPEMRKLLLDAVFARIARQGKRA